MAGRWTDPAAFRADPSAAPAATPSRRQSVALLAVLILAAAAVAAASYWVRPDRARAFELLHGSVFIADQAGPVAVDLASAKPTFRLLGAENLVGVKSTSAMSLVPLDGGTLLLNKASGQFNMVDNTGFAVKHDGSGVQFGQPRVNPSSVGFASGKFAYIERTSAGTTDVYLISKLTVESAVSGPKAVKARAGITLKDTGSTAAGGAAAANGDLWLLLGSGTTRTIQQLSVPPNSSAGVALTTEPEGTVDGAAAIGSATLRADGTGPTTVAVASADRIQIFPSGSSPTTLRFATQSGVDQILPTSSGQGRISFLMHSDTGWSVLSVGADGTEMRGPTHLDGVDPNFKLIAPAASRGSLYTMETADGQIFRIGPDDRAVAVPGAAAYPIVESVEPEGFADAYVTAQASRVIFDSPAHSNAIAIFADGSRTPQLIKKSNATTVSVTGGAEALTKPRINPNQPPGVKPPTGPPPAHPVTSVPINNRIDCATVTQKPHIPTIVSAVPGSRTVALQWTYPTISPQDCVPRTYVVSLQLVSNDAPAAPASVRVDSQTGANIGGLFPSTQYRITLTAYINGQGTSSGSTVITTGPEGPKAPTGLRVGTDSAGNWVLDWDSCGDVEQGCVEAASWRVIPSICDGGGLANPPTPMEVDADPTTRQQPPATYKGNDALLGRGLQFQVEGVGLTGAIGDASAKTACTTSWSPPVAIAMRLSASQPATTTLNGSASTTVTLDLGTNPVHTVGGIGAAVLFHLTGPAGTQTSAPIVYTGSGSSLSATFDGVRAGEQYSASVTVSAPHHPSSSATLGPVPVTTSAVWPAMTISASCDTGGGLIHLTCDLTVNLGGLHSADAHGERFDIIDTGSTNSQLRCGGGPAASLDRANIDPDAPITLNNLSLLFYNGACTVTVVLQEASGTPGPLVFGGTTSDVLQADFVVGHPTTYNASPGDFTVGWDTNASGSQAFVQYVGSVLTEAQLGELTQNWQETINAPNGSNCGSAAAQPTTGGIDVVADDSCVRNFGTDDGWTVTIRYDDQGTTNTHTIDPIPLTGVPPGYQPCVPGDFAAAWGATLADGVTVTYSGDDTMLGGCSNWQYTLQDDKGKACGSPDQDPAPPASSVILVSGPGNSCPVGDGWTVAISWNDTAGDKQSVSPDIPVAGTPPTS